MPETLSSTPTAWRPPVLVAAIALPFLTCAALSAFRDDVTAATSVLVLVLIVVGAAATGDRLAGLLAALSSGAWFDFFLVPPYHRFAIDNRDDVEATLLLVVISIAVTEVALWGHRQQARASRRSGYLEGVLDVARAVAEGDAPSSTVTDLVAAQITEVLDADSAHFVKGPVLDDRFAVLEGTHIVLKLLIRSNVSFDELNTHFPRSFPSELRGFNSGGTPRIVECNHSANRRDNLFQDFQTFCCEIRDGIIDATEPSAWLGEAVDQSQSNRVGTCAENDR